jgi:hypothetical protein
MTVTRFVSERCAGAGWIAHCAGEATVYLQCVAFVDRYVAAYRAVLRVDVLIELFD